MNADRRNRPPVPAWLGRLLEPLYRRAIAGRNREFDDTRILSIGVPVISVGNLSVGGTGKTPTVMRIVELATAMGKRPCIAMRGYKKKGEGLSDEQAEYIARYPNIAIVAQPDRRSALDALKVLNPNAYDCVILDDGFQHRQIARDLDIVLIDATRDVFADRCLPAGWLREPVESLARADIVLITHAESVPRETLDRMTKRVREIAPRATCAIAHHRWRSLAIDNEERSPDWLAGKTVAALCGIGHPAAFIAAIERTGARIVTRMVRPDHHHWSTTELASLRTARVDAIVTTAKDWSKLAPLTSGWTGPRFVRPILEMALVEGEAEFARRIHHTLTTPSSLPRIPLAPPATVSV